MTFHKNSFLLNTLNEKEIDFYKIFIPHVKANRDWIKFTKKRRDKRF